MRWLPRRGPRAARTAELRARRREIRREARAESFASRDPVVIGAVGLVLLAVLVTGAFYVSDLPIIGGGTAYSAEFGDAGGLRTGDDVRIAGLKVGQVTAINLDQAQVKVTFRVKHAYVGDQSTVSINVKTLLGAMYLAIDSTGDHAQQPASTIPQSRTTSPYDITTALTELSTTVSKIDTAQLARSFDVLAAAGSQTTKSIKPLLTGLAGASQIVAENDAQLRSLLGSAKAVTGVLAQQQAHVQSILDHGTALLAVLNDRRAAIDQLLSGTSSLSVQLSGLVADNQAALSPALTQLQNVISILQANRSSIDQALSELAPFFRYVSNATGNGPWIDGYVWNATRQGLLHLYLGGKPDA